MGGPLSSGKQRTPNRIRFPCDDRQKGPGGAGGDSPTVLPMFQSPFAETEQLGKLALRKGDLLPDRLDIDCLRHVYFTAMVFLAFGKGEGLSGTLDHALARGWFPFHFDFLVYL
jgi:hypothetical protein